MTQNDNGFKAFTVTTTAVVAFRLVKYVASDGSITPVTAVADIPIGVAQFDAAVGDQCNVKLLTAPGTFKVMAGGAITANTECYMLSSGKIDDSDPGSGVKWMRALGAASGDGSIIEAYPMKN